MSLIDWDQSFSLGVESIDADHQRLLEILNSLYDAWRANKGTELLASLFDSLEAYTAEHFGREEALMLSCHYDQLGKHMLAHAELKERVRSFRSAHLAGSEPAKLTADVAKFLKSWLLDHILTEDMLYKDHIQKR